jgi:hypothetical protein
MPVTRLKGAGIHASGSESLALVRRGIVGTLKPPHEPVEMELAKLLRSRLVALLSVCGAELLGQLPDISDQSCGQFRGGDDDLLSCWSG